MLTRHQTAYDCAPHRAIYHVLTDMLYLDMPAQRRDVAGFHDRVADAVAAALAAVGSSVSVALNRTMVRLCG
jgi:hypothetical protein